MTQDISAPGQFMNNNNKYHHSKCQSFAYRGCNILLYNICRIQCFPILQKSF